MKLLLKIFLIFFPHSVILNISHGKGRVYPLIMKKKKIKTKIKSTKSLEKLAKTGFQGYPIATVACYGPDDQHATKAAVGIVYNEEGKDYPEGSKCPKCPPKKHNVIPPFYVPDLACFQTKKWVWSYNKSPFGCFLGNQRSLYGRNNSL